MKKIFALLLCLVMLTGCGQKKDYSLPDNYEAVIHFNNPEGKTYTGKIEVKGNSTGREDTYEFVLQKGKCEITYPNGAVFSDGEITGDAGGYIDGNILESMLANSVKPAAEKDSELFFIGVIVIVIGLFNALTPETAWYISIGWRIKDSKPTEGAVKFGRIAGIAAAVIGFIMVFMA